MGDNRNYSSDSRVFGLVPRKNILAKAILRIWPLGHFGGLGAGPTIEPVTTTALAIPALGDRGVRVLALAAPAHAQARCRVDRARRAPRPLRTAGVTRASAAHPRGVDAAPLDELVGCKEQRHLLRAASRESLPCTTLLPMLTARSPRMLPGAAADGLVAPIIARTCATASSPSHTMATTGAEVMNATRPAKNGLP